jgi:predicted AAA+ superfamily ATPase
MFKRALSKQLVKSLKSYSVLTLLGPRQSGKTTLVRHLFPQFDYRSLENPDERAMAIDDPKGFLNGLGDRCILDEFQRVPQLSSYIQGIVDEPDNDRKFILTGSNGLLLVDSITQTMAGRTELFELLPLSYREISKKRKSMTLNEYLFNGGFPRIYKEKLNPTKWLRSYFALYVEKDIRQITNIKNMDTFARFIKLAAGRTGQLLNSANLGNEAGVTAPTINQWISALKSTYICFTLQPHFKNFNKRIVKSAKLYFYDTGLLCYLLGINDKKQLDTHPLRGHIFENFIISEYYKNKLNNGEEPSLYYWRDQKGHEIDLVVDHSSYLFAIEIKLSQTFNRSFIKNINYFNKLQKEAETQLPEVNGQVVFCGDTETVFKNIEIQNWMNFL